jgi:hypothetical protein
MNRLSQILVMRLCVVLVFILLLGKWIPADARRALPERQAQTDLSASRLIPSVVYMTTDRHLHELALMNGSWHDTDLTVAAGGAPLVYGPFSALRRGDGVSAIYYHGPYDSDNLSHLYELRLEGGVWKWSDLTQISGAPWAVYYDTTESYVRSDGITAVVFHGGYYNSHLFELRLEDTWKWSDLTPTPGTPLPGGGGSAYVRSDNISTVVYTGGSDYHIYELRLESVWVWADLTAAASAPTNHEGYSRAYRRSDGVSSVIFVPYNDYHVNELWLGGDGWHHTDLTTQTGSPVAGSYSIPFPYVRGDGINAVLYRTGVNHIGELRLDNGWKYFDMQTAPNAPTECTSPQGYVRADGITAVVCKTPGVIGPFHIYEARLAPGGWIWSDLTSISAAPEIWGGFFAYNRGWPYELWLPLIMKL